MSNSLVDAVDRHTVPARCLYDNNPTMGPSSSNDSPFAPREPLKDQTRLKLKMFPFMAPAFQESAGSRMMMGQQVVATGPSFPASSTRPLLASEARTKASSGQLTIFYKGQVHVYNNVVPAKDIMLMAAAHDSLSEPLELSIKTSYSHVNVECEKMPHNIDLNTTSEPNQSHANQASANLVPIKIRMIPFEDEADSSIVECDKLLHNIDLNTTSEPNQSHANQAGANLVPTRIRMILHEDEADRFIVGPNNSFVEEEPLVPQALPQARKASLARFLERRKERLMAKSPYSHERSSY